MHESYKALSVNTLEEKQSQKMKNGFKHRARAAFGQLLSKRPFMYM